MYRFLLCLALALPLSSEIVDRIAITIDHQVITELQVAEELRVTALQNQEPLSSDLDARRAAADRIVAQLLVIREMELSHYVKPESVDVDQYLDQVRKSFGSGSEYQQALHRYQITEPVLKQHLANELAVLDFIEVRFRPNLDVPDSEIESFYNREIASWRMDHPDVPPPNFDAARPAILKTLTEEHTDQILDTWLEEARKQVNIIYLDKSLQ
jgi:transposase InsO family protein